MQVYLVGGAVRDQLLGLEIKERDWVVVGASVKEMLSLGYKQVGKDFPVFLHPQTKEEYALARTERKTAAGYHGFTVHADPSVTLEQDLQRRDLTINAIAKTDNGELIDPYNGQQDIASKILRHVSPAFSEDPVRVLRIARFSSRFTKFEVAEETMQLMQQMSASGEMDSTVAERVWQETSRALKQNAPWRFFEILQKAKTLEIIMPELTIEAVNSDRIKSFCNKKINSQQLWALILYGIDSDKANSLNKRLRTPSKYSELSRMMHKHADKIINYNKLSAEELLQLILSCDALRRADRFNELLETVIALRENTDTDAEKNNINFLKTIATEINNISLEQALSKGLSGSELANEIKQIRIDKIKQLQKLVI